MPTPSSAKPASRPDHWMSAPGALVKLALAIGIASEGAVHSHARRALEEGLTPEELLHVVLLAIPTTGLPNAVKALAWVEDIRSGMAKQPK
jgi:alkylhydroperoxidase/carboxymuconolactone decarboxylase family protein YurZ